MGPVTTEARVEDDAVARRDAARCRGRFSPRRRGRWCQPFSTLSQRGAAHVYQSCEVGPLSRKRSACSDATRLSLISRGADQYSVEVHPSGLGDIEQAEALRLVHIQPTRSWRISNPPANAVVGAADDDLWRNLRCAEVVSGQGSQLCFVCGAFPFEAQSKHCVQASFHD